MSGAGDRMTELAYAAGWRMVRAMPPPLARGVFAAAADRATRRRGRGVLRLESNLRTVVGDGMREVEFRALVKAAVRSYSRYWMELFRLPDRSKQEILDGLELEGVDLLEATLNGGKGVVIALPHMANWDAAGAWVAARGWPITTVAERLKSEGLYERFLAFRRGLGMEILPSHGADRSVLETLSQRLREGACVPLVADRDLSNRGVEVRFFGRTATMPPGPALLAVRTGAPLVTVSLWYEADRVRGRVDPPLTVPETGSVGDRVRVMTQQMADNFAAGIAEHPADWHMMQRVWRDPVAQVSAAAGTGS